MELTLKATHAFYHMMAALTRRLLKVGDRPEPDFQVLVDTAVNDMTNAVYGMGRWSAPGPKRMHAPVTNGGPKEAGSVGLSSLLATCASARH